MSNLKDSKSPSVIVLLRRIQMFDIGLKLNTKHY